MPKLNLRQLILLLTVSTALLILANTFYTSYQTQRELLLAQTLEANQAYAAKMASSIDSFLSSAQQQLAFAAQDVLLADNDSQKLKHVTDRLKQQTDSFNSVLVVNPQGKVLAATPNTLGLLGQTADREGALQALQERKPLISHPYISETERLLVFITYPVVDAQGVYQGFVGGSIYLHEQSILYSLLGQHYHADDSYIYVVDQNARVLYHQDSKRVGEVVQGNAVIEKVIAGQSGSQQLINSKGVAMLAGYAPVRNAGWGVVTQRSLQVTMTSMHKQMRLVAQYSFPFFILILWLVWVASRWISKPLWQLARCAEYLDETNVNLRILGISSWYFEAAQLKRAILRGLAGLNRKMGRLNLENITDPLTGLVNRRGMQVTLDAWEQARQPFSVILGDIDYFKRINDTFGHDVGDAVLQFLAKQMLGSSRPDDLICRIGGEEFVMLLPKTDINIAFKTAERLRQQIEESLCPPIGQAITLSFGVASWPNEQASIADVIKQADQALYSAKAAGRNRVHSSQTTDITTYETL